MEVKNVFVVFTDVECDLICVNSNMIHTICIDNEERMTISTNSEIYEVLDSEKMAISKLLYLIGLC